MEGLLGSPETKFIYKRLTLALLINAGTFVNQMGEKRTLTYFEIFDNPPPPTTLFYYIKMVLLREVILSKMNNSASSKIGVQKMDYGEKFFSGINMS